MHSVTYASGFKIMISMLPFVLLVGGLIYWLVSSRGHAELTAGQRSRRCGFKVLLGLLCLPFLLALFASFFVGFRVQRHGSVTQTTTYVDNQPATITDLNPQHQDIFASQLMHFVSNSRDELAQINQQHQQRTAEIHSQYDHGLKQLIQQEEQNNTEQIAEWRTKELEQLKNEQIGDPAAVRREIDQIERTYQQKLNQRDNMLRSLTAQKDQILRGKMASLNSELRNFESRVNGFRHQLERQVEQYRDLLAQYDWRNITRQGQVSQFIDSAAIEREFDRLKDFKQKLQAEASALTPLAGQLELLLREVQVAANTAAETVAAETLAKITDPLVAPLPGVSRADAPQLDAPPPAGHAAEEKSVAGRVGTIEAKAQVQTAHAEPQPQNEPRNQNEQGPQLQNSAGDESELPEWAKVDPRILRTTGNVSETLLVSKQYSTVDEAERELQAVARSIMHGYLIDQGLHPANHLEIPAHVVAHHLNGRKYVETIDRQSGTTQFRVFRIYRELKITPELVKEIRPQLVKSRVRLLGGVVLALMLLVGTIFAYLQIDANTFGAYRGRLKLAAFAFLTCTLLVTLSVIARIS